MVPEINHIKAGTVKELNSKGCLWVKALGKRIGVFKNDDGLIYGKEMNCKHQGADLRAGTLKNGTITCPRHGWEYDIQSGECLNQKGSPSLRDHEVQIDGDSILVAIRPSPRTGNPR